MPLPPWIIPSESIADRVHLTTTPNDAGLLDVSLLIRNCDWAKSSDHFTDSFRGPPFQLCTLSQQVRQRLPTDQRFATGPVKGYFGVNLGPHQTRYGLVDISCKLEIQAWRQRAPLATGSH